MNDIIAIHVSALFYISRYHDIAKVNHTSWGNNHYSS